MLSFINLNYQNQWLNQIVLYILAKSDWVLLQGGEAITELCSYLPPVRKLR
jgi:hypothetical protein